jgi:hypothetical protein
LIWRSEGGKEDDEAVWAVVFEDPENVRGVSVCVEVGKRAR